MDEKRRNVKNRWFYGLGTVGRDFYYTMVSMYLMFYLTDIWNSMRLRCGMSRGRTDTGLRCLQ